MKEGLTSRARARFETSQRGKGWTQAYVAELVGKTDRTIMNIENKGQHPSFNLFFKLVTLFDISVDQFFYTEGQRGENSCRKHIDVLLSSMNEKELVVMEATAEGSRKPEKRRFQNKGLCFFAPFSGLPLSGKQCLRGHKGPDAVCWGSPQTRIFGPTWPEVFASLCFLFS